MQFFQNEFSRLQQSLLENIKGKNPRDLDGAIKQSFDDCFNELVYDYCDLAEIDLDEWDGYYTALELKSDFIKATLEQAKKQLA